MGCIFLLDQSFKKNADKHQTYQRKNNPYWLDRKLLVEQNAHDKRHQDFKNGNTMKLASSLHIIVIF